jgi:uncharacterized protein (TIGR00297 family)
MTFLTLDRNGIIAALILGALLLVFGGFSPIFVMFMLYFLVLSAIVTAAGKHYKKKIKVYEKSRGVWNVLSNGLGPLIFTVAFFILFEVFGLNVAAYLAIVGFGASVASITADKFSSEIGVLDGTPRDIFTYKKLKKGMSGGITSFGLLAGLIGSILISVPFVYFSFYSAVFSQGITYIAILAASIIIGGFAGTIVDSAMGHFEELGIGNKFTSNFVCSICGGIIGIIVLLLLL